MKKLNELQQTRLNKMNPEMRRLAIEEAEQGLPGVEHLPPPVGSSPDQSELFDVSISVAMLLHAHRVGDEKKIQDAIDLLADWDRRRGDRLTNEQLGYKKKAGL